MRKTAHPSHTPTNTHRQLHALLLNIRWNLLKAFNLKSYALRWPLSLAWSFFGSWLLERVMSQFSQHQHWNLTILNKKEKTKPKNVIKNIMDNCENLRPETAKGKSWLKVQATESVLFSCWQWNEIKTVCIRSSLLPVSALLHTRDVAHTCVWECGTERDLYRFLFCWAICQIFQTLKNSAVSHQQQNSPISEISQTMRVCVCVFQRQQKWETVL